MFLSNILSLSPYVSFVESDSDYVLWLSISKKAYTTDEDIIVGAIYIPPADSRFYNPDEIEQFNVEITTMCVSNKYVLLMGDFNARTHNKQDYMDEDQFFCRQFDYDKDLIDHFQNSSILDQYNRGVSHYRILPISRDIGWPVQQLDYFRYKATYTGCRTSIISVKILFKE